MLKVEARSHVRARLQTACNRVHFLLAQVLEAASMRLTEAPYALVIVICRCSNWPSIEMRSRML